LYMYKIKNNTEKGTKHGMPKLLGKNTQVC